MNERAALVGATIALACCGGAYLTAPPGSTLVLVANPNFIPSHGGVAELQAIVTEPIGTDVPDGTVVLWSTTLGHVDRETRTVRGIARNRLVSDSRSGTAQVTASSGGEAVIPSPSSPSPSGNPTSTTVTTNTTRPSASEFSAASSGLSDAMRPSASATITIGNALVAFVRLRATPSRLTISNSTHVIATVTDRDGNPVANVPVFFEVVSDKDTDFFESAGAPVFTNQNGEAEDLLRTRRVLVGLPIRVIASAAGAGRFVPSPVLEIPVL